METKQCQNCNKDFIIEPDDFLFYEKIKVPPPTFCFDCRLQRKMIRRNERNLHKINCKKCTTSVVSMYGENTKFNIFCNDCWWKDGWGPIDFGINYDFSKSFFDQFLDLSLSVPRVSLFQKVNINSPYTNHSDHNKNCYLCFNNGFIEDSMYCKWGVSSRQIFDCYNASDSELCYELNECSRCSKSSYLFFCKGCIDCYYLYSCRNCSNCFLSSNLINKKYVFKNKQYTKEEYEEKIKKFFENASYKIHLDILDAFNNEILLKTPRKFRFDGKVVNSLGDYLFGGCKNLKKCFHMDKSEDCGYCVDDSDMKDSYDSYESAFNCELQYDCHACNRLSRGKFNSISYDCHDINYSEMCHNSSNLFACIGLRNKSYCILNKQYTKEQYEELVPKIIKHMSDMPYIDSKGRVYKYGEFFPSELSPFAYNETIAQEYFPLTKEQAIDQGYKWKDKEERNYSIDIRTEDIWDSIRDIPDTDILNKVIECAHKGTCNQQCTEAFKIIPEELSFYRRMNLPLPRLCPNCRHYERLAQRNPMKLWHRKCMKKGCNNEFETSYAPERPEIVYCEKC